MMHRQVRQESAPTLCIARAENDRLFDTDGRPYIDLFSGHGATWLCHSNPRVAAVVSEQLGKAWLTASLPTPILAEARSLIEGYFPSSHRLAMLYSTGMEAAEFALRVARVVTGKAGVRGFQRSMHGKSLATAALGWDNPGRPPQDFQRLPFVPQSSEDRILEHLDHALEHGSVAAVFVEPLQGCGGGYAASAPFYREVASRCAARGALLVFDEILTGFFRTGPPFFFSDLGIVPDIVLLGKALGNGFPVSAVVLHERFTLSREMLPGSTFAGNPLAAAAVVGTLRLLPTLDLPARVARIEKTIQTTFAPLSACGIVPRGRGALWAIEVPPGPDVETLVVGIYRSGVAVGFAGRLLRVLPAATIEQDNLEQACAVLRDALLRDCARTPVGAPGGGGMV